MSGEGAVEPGVTMHSPLRTLADLDAWLACLFVPRHCQWLSRLQKCRIILFKSTGCTFFQEKEWVQVAHTESCNAALVRSRCMQAACTTPAAHY